MKDVEIKINMDCITNTGLIIWSIIMICSGYLIHWLITEYKDKGCGNKMEKCKICGYISKNIKSMEKHYLKKHLSHHNDFKNNYRKNERCGN